jgi:hypothetical protein
MNGQTWIVDGLSIPQLAIVGLTVLAATLVARHYAVIFAETLARYLGELRARRRFRRGLLVEVELRG